MSRTPLALPGPTARLGDVDVAALLRAQAHALRAQADVIDAQARALEADAPLAVCAAEPPLLTKQQLGAALGVSVATIDRLCREREIPFLTVGDSRRFDLAQVRAVLVARAREKPRALAQPAHEAAPNGVRRLSRGGRG